MMMKRIACGIGIGASLLAAEGLNRFGSMVTALRGGDAPFYEAFLYVSIASAGVFLISFFKEIPKAVKILVMLALFASAGLMLQAPAFPVNQQILAGLSVAALASLAIPTAGKVAESVTEAESSEEKKA